jgi:flagellar assembly protein FliH
MEGEVVSGLLKAGDRTAQSAVRRLGAVPLAPRPAVVAPSTPAAPEPEQVQAARGPDRNSARTEELDRHCMALEAQIADLRHQLHEAEQAAETRIREALERGRDEGKEQAESGERLRLEALGNALGGIGREHGERLGDCELLALQLARTAMSRIFGEDEGRLAGQVSATLRHHLGRVQPELVVGVRVSPEDFPDEAGFAALAQEHRAVALRKDPDLASGECEIDLKLGRIDIGLAGQWQRLSAYFDELANEGRRG